jgi:hypothetical protein
MKRRRKEQRRRRRKEKKTKKLGRGASGKIRREKERRCGFHLRDERLLYR